MLFDHAKIIPYMIFRWYSDDICHFYAIYHLNIWENMGPKPHKLTHTLVSADTAVAMEDSSWSTCSTDSRLHFLRQPGKRGMSSDKNVEIKVIYWDFRWFQPDLECLWLIQYDLLWINTMIPYESMKMQVSYQNMVAGSQHGDSLKKFSTNAARADWDNALIKKNMVAATKQETYALMFINQIYKDKHVSSYLVPVGYMIPTAGRDQRRLPSLKPTWIRRSMKLRSLCPQKEHALGSWGQTCAT